MTKKQFLFAMLLMAAVLSCSKMPVYQSKESTTSESNDFPVIATDQHSKNNEITYGVADNDTNLYFKAVFHDKQSFMKILRGGGLNLYFDPSGKTKKDYSLNIERSREKAMGEQNMRQQYGTSRDEIRQNMAAIISVVCDRVTWGADGEEFIFYRNELKDPIRVELHANENNELVLELEMPLTELNLPEGQKNFSMGIATNTIATENAARSGGGMRAGGVMPQGGGRGGQRPGGGSGGSRPRTGQSGGGSTATNGMSPIKVWFQVEL